MPPLTPSQIFDEAKRIFDQDRALKQTPMARVNLQTPEGKKFGWGIIIDAKTMGLEASIPTIEGKKALPSLFPQFIIYVTPEHIRGAIRHQLEAWFANLSEQGVSMEVSNVDEQMRQHIMDLVRLRIAMQTNWRAKA